MGKASRKQFGIRQDAVAVGDFNGDGRDDVITFTRGDSADVLFSLAMPAGGFAAAQRLSGEFVIRQDAVSVGDFNGDGRDDVITFTRGDSADVWVAIASSARG